MQDTRALTNVEMAACNLPGREPFPPFDPLDWYEEPNLGESSDTARNNEPTQLGTLEAPSGRTGGDSRKGGLDSGKIPAIRSGQARDLAHGSATGSKTTDAGCAASAPSQRTKSRK